VKVRFELILLTHVGQILLSFQDFYALSDIDNEYGCNFHGRIMEHETSPLLHVRCDMAVVKGIMAMPPPNLLRCIGYLHGSLVRGDVI
jgi:hypothetical protein